MAFSFSALGTIRSACEPDGHPGLKFGHIALGIEAQAQRIAVVITDRALGLPSRKWPQPQELRDERRGRFARAHPSHIDRHSHPDAAQEIFPTCSRSGQFDAQCDTEACATLFLMCHHFHNVSCK
jgi:hypothetical protein